MTEARHPMQPIVRDQIGTYRFKHNAIVRHLLDSGSIDLNQIAAMNFSDEDREQFAQLIGYSVDGFCEMDYASRRAKDEADEYLYQLESRRQWKRSRLR